MPADYDVMIGRSQRLTPTDELGPVRDPLTNKLRPWEPGDAFASRRLAIMQSLPGTFLLVMALIAAAVLVSGAYS